MDYAEEERTSTFGVFIKPLAQHVDIWSTESKCCSRSTVSVGVCLRFPTVSATVTARSHPSFVPEVQVFDQAGFALSFHRRETEGC